MKIYKLGILISLFCFACSNDDDSLIPQCIAPSGQTETGITAHEATLQWNNTNAANQFKIEYGFSGFAFGNGQTITVNEPTITLTNLQANTTYDYYVVSLCNINNNSLPSSIKSFTTAAPYVVPQLTAKLSQMNLYQGNLKDLTPSTYVFEYQLSTTLFTDYAHKQRLVALPPGTSMMSNGGGLPEFPENTVISKTFYYNVNDAYLDLGKTIVETRILILKNGIWELGNYKWNATQTDAFLDTDGGIVPLDWIDTQGQAHSVSYQIPNAQDCITCHDNGGTIIPIGPQLRSLNFKVNGSNQLTTLKNLDLLDGINNTNALGSLPNWENTNTTITDRGRAYMDMNCAHCHQPGGFCYPEIPLDLRFETSYENTEIEAYKYAIIGYMSFYNPGVSMPLIGTTMVHQEGYDLIVAYVNALE